MMWFANPRRSFNSINRRHRLTKAARAAVGGVVGHALQHGERLETRRLLATLNGTANGDIITVDISGANIVITLNGVPNNFSDAANVDIIVNGAGGADTITVIRNGANPTTINGGDGDDLIRVGNGTYEGLITSTVRVNGDTQVTGDTVIFDDVSAVSGDTYTYAGATITRTGAPAMSYGTVENVTLNTTGLIDTIIVDNISSGVNASINAGSGADSITVGPDYDSSIFSPLTVNGGAGSDSMTIEDGVDTTPDAYIFDTVGLNPTFTKDTSSFVMHYPAVDSIVLNANTGVFANAFNILDLGGGPTTINAGDGDDTLNYGDGVSDMNVIDSAVTFNGQLGTDRINVNGQTASITPSYTMTVNSIDTTQTASIDFGSDTEQVSVTGGAGNEFFNVSSTPLTALVTVNGGDGGDTMEYGGGDILSNVDENYTYIGGAGDDLLIINDSFAASARTWTFPGSSATITGGDGITWNTLGATATDRVSLLGGAGADVFNVNASNSNVSMTVQGGGGDDTMTAGNAVSGLNVWPGLVVFEGGANADSLVIEDAAANATAQTYSFNGVSTTLFTRTGLTGSVGFTNTTETVELIAGTGGASALGQTFDVNELADVGSLIVTAGDGADTVNIGGGDWGANILRPVSVVGGAATDRVVINSAADTSADTYTLLGSSIRSAAAGVGDEIFWDPTTENIDLTGTALADLFLLNGSGSVLAANNITLRGNGGSDTLTSVAADIDIDNAILGDLDFFGDADTDLITFVDVETADGGENYTIAAGIFDKTSATFGTFGYNSTTETLDFTLDDDASVITVGAFNDGQSATINAGDGNDTVQNQTITNNWSTDWEDAQVYVRGGAGLDSLILNDSAATTVEYTFTEDNIFAEPNGGLGRAQLNYDVFDIVTVTTSDVASTLNIQAIDEADTVSINGGDGNDLFSVGGASGRDLDGAVSNFDVPSSLVLNGGFGLDSLDFLDTDADVGDDVYEVRSSSVIISDGTTTAVSFGYTGFEGRLVITQAGSTAKTFQVVDTLSVLPLTLNGGAANDVFTLSPVAQDLDNIDTPVVVNGGGGTDSVLINDDADTLARTYTVNGSFFDRTGSFGSLFHSGVELVDLDAGTLDDVINITAQTAGVPLNASGLGGNDTFNVGGAGTGNVDAIDGIVTLLGGVGTDSVNYNDQLNATPGTTYFIGSDVARQRVTRTGAADVIIGVDNESVTFNTAVANSVINFDGWNGLFNSEPTLNAGAGNDTIFVGNGDFDTNVQEPIRINAGGGVDFMSLNDSTDNDVGDTYTVTSGTIADSGTASILSYTGNQLEQLRIDLPGGAETVNVNSLTATVSATINGSAGNDTVNVGVGNVEVLSSAALLFDGGADNDQLILDDTGAGDADTWTYSVVSPLIGQVSDTSDGNAVVLQYTDISLVVHNSGAPAERYDIAGLINGTGVTINAGGGNDTLDYGGSGNNVDPIDSTLTFGGDANNDTILYDDSAAPSGRTYTIESSFLDTNLSGVLNYGTTETVSINSGTGNDTILVEGTASGTTYDVAAGGGTDRFDVGDTTNDIDANILSTITLGGGAGDDTINYNDTGDTADADSYTFDASDLFTKSSLPVGVVIDGNLIEFTTLNANNGNNIILANVAPSNLTINANGGDDNIQIADGGTSANPVIVTSGAGADTVNVDGDADAVEAFVRFAGTDEIARMSIGVGSTLQNGPGNSTLIVTSSFSFGGTFDVGSGFLIFRVGVSPLNTYQTLLTNGYAAGAWNGNFQSISSSAANASPRADGVGIRLATDPNLPGANVITFGGQAVNPGDVLLGYMQNGDTDLDRDVDFDDLLRQAQNYGLAGLRVWTQGNSDYDADVDFDDLLSLAQNYGLPFLTVSPSDGEMASARSTLASLTKRRGLTPTFSRALTNVLRTMDDEKAVFSSATAIA